MEAKAEAEKNEKEQAEKRAMNKLHYSKALEKKRQKLLKEEMGQKEAASGSENEEEPEI